MTDIKIADLSDGVITTIDNTYVWDGTGVFDVLMKAINGNIKVQYDNGNIDTSQYATVYLGAIQTAIQSAVDFLLREKLTEAQVDDALKGTLLKQEQIDASQADTLRSNAESIEKIALMQEQINASIADTAIKQAQSVAEIALRNEQVVASIAETERSYNESVAKIATMNEQIAASQVEMAIKLDQAAKDLLIKDEQIAASIVGRDKLAAETAEIAGNAAKQREVLQAQKELYKRQKAGFDDNKQQKILEAQLNAWGITFQDTDTTFLPTQLAQAGFTESFNAVRANYYDVCDDVCGA